MSSDNSIKVYKNKRPIINKTQPFTKAQEIFTENYYWGEPGIAGNAVECYKIAYPNQSPQCAKAHSSKILKSAGVQAAFLVLKQKYDRELQVTINSNPEVMSKERWLLKTSAMAENKPHPVTGKKLYSEQLEKWGMQAMGMIHGVFDKKTQADVGMTNIQINVNPTDNKNISVKSEKVDEVEWHETKDI